MADGVKIKDVNNILSNISDTAKIPVSSGTETEPQVVTVGGLKGYINTGMQAEIDDLSTIRSGAALGATAYQKPGTGIPSTDLESGVIPDVSGFITNTVDDLVNYYTKSETYSQTEVQQLISAVKQFTYELVSVLPTASASTMNKIYLVPSSDPQTQNIKDEYITLESSGSYSWEQIGSTAIDLSGYVTTSALNTALADYTTSADLSTLLAGYQTKIDSTHKLDYSLIDNTPTIPDITNCVQKSETAGLIKNDGTVDTNTYLTSAHEVPSGGNSGQVLKKTSGSDYAYGWGNINETYPSAYCSTSGGTATKVANCSLWTATANTYLHILIGTANTYQGALMLKVNGSPAPSGAPIYINGAASSSTNYTLPAGSYIIFYDGTNFYFNTQGKIPTATSVLASVADVPDVSNYVQKNSTNGLLKNDGTVDTSTYLTSAPVTSVNGNTGDVTISTGDTNIIEEIKLDGESSSLTPSSKVVTIPSMGASGSNHRGGLVPDPGSTSGTTKYLREDGSWQTPPDTDTTYSASDFDIKDLADSTSLMSTWSGKQDALSSQTAYTSQGSATKVPQITTNSLGQVTGITEVTITQPDVSNFISTSSTTGLVKNDGSIDTNTYLTSSDLSGYVQTSSTTGLLKNDGTVDTTSYGTYSKPSGGIPAADLASGVIPTVPSNIVTGSSQSYTIWTGDETAYEQISTKDSSTLYFITET